MKSVSSRAVKRPETGLEIGRHCVGTFDFSQIPHGVVRLEKRARDCTLVAQIKMFRIVVVVKASGDAI